MAATTRRRGSPVPGDNAGTDELLSLEDISVSFRRRTGWTEVVSAVSLTVRANETVGLVGESGSGKSVTCMTAAGLISHLGGRVTSGTIRLGGEDVTNAPERRLRQLRSSFVGAVFQQPTRSLNPAYTIGDQIAEVLRLKRGLSRKAAWKEAVELLDRVHVANAAERAHDYPHMMSGGMCQRVMIAIAVACKPRLLIADEPTTALDTTVQRQVLTLLEDLKAELSLGVLYVSHDLGVVRDIAQRTIVLYAGEIVEEAPTAQAFATPLHPYTHGLIASTPGVGAKTRLGFIPGAIPDVGNLPPGCRFQERCEWCTEACTTSPIELRANSPERRVRCIRSEELDLRGAR
jgi:peptide/nickel transport system ATP-binding protein